MRAVILYNTSWYVYLLRRNLIEKLRKAGIDISVVAPKDTYTDRVRQLQVDFIPITMSQTGKSPLRELETLTQIYVTLRALKPDAVLSFTVKCNLYAGLCRSRLQFRHIANISGTGDLFDGTSLLDRFAKGLYGRALRHTHKVFFQNGDDQRTFLKNGLVQAEQSEVIPGSGVDLSHFYPMSRDTRPYRAFLMFGRILPKKGFGRFLDAATDLKARYGKSAQFWILGAPDSERSESRQLFERILRAHEDGIVRYINPTDHVLPHLHEADAVVLPSTYNEGVPRSLLEALACGKPIITTDWKGCRETVENGQNGLLVAPHDTESLTRALRRLIECSEETLVEYGLRSRALAEARFDEQLVLDAYLNAVQGEHPVADFAVEPRAIDESDQGSAHSVPAR
jgi:glycosyltransferase involved in cell wall biosynthesis